MSDQSSATQKPKPGSLRDRIAAFEKSAGAGAANAPPPPRPKPAGFATWKPKQHSPPSSPPAQTEHVQGSSASMSASDARESIVKGASLKDRMAALQNKGAFGGPPPVGPKPIVERPKWKPPPVVQPDKADGPSEGISAIEKSLSPPLDHVAHEQNEGDSIQSETDPTQGATAEGADESAEATQDPEEEERQRRAAIAARMARLGGARVGMGPPIIGKKPLVRRPTQEEQQMTLEDTKLADTSLEPSAPPEEKIPSSNEPVSIPSEPETQEPGITPSRKSSLTITAEVVSGHSPKLPASMPVPAVPRRTGPPRRKPSKPIAPPPEPLEEAVPDVDIAASTPVSVHEGTEPILGTSESLASQEASSTIKDSVPPGNLEEAAALHDESGAPESVESAAPPLSPVQLADHSPTHTSEISTAVETVDEEVIPRSHSPSPSGTPPAQHAVIGVSEPASEVLEHEDYDSDEKFTDKPLGGLSTNPLVEEVHSEPSKSVSEDFIHEDGNDQSEVVGYSKLDKPNDRNPRVPPPVPANRPSLTSTKFDTPESVDAPQLSGHSSASLERRSVPPRRIVPAAPVGDADPELVESDEEVNENLARSHLFIPPPKERAIHLQHRNIQDEDDGAGDGSENDTPALPVPHRRSMDMRTSRSIIPSMHSDSSSEPDTDHDGQALPVPPRPTARVVPSPRSREASQNEDDEPRNVSISISTPFPLDREVMDEDEGDPIDPDFHLPSRRSSYLNLAHRTSLSTPVGSSTPSIPGSRPQTLQSVHQPGQTNQLEERTLESEEDAAETRKRTIAERMARLGGIKFGTAPVPRTTSSAVHESGGVDAADMVEDKADEPGNEEEEERARKERIAAKLASMGGMRIGMMPIGIGGIPVKGSQIREEASPSSPPNPVVPVRPSRIAPQPPEQTHDAEPDTGSPNTSDDGVRVEAEESEAEEVNYQDAEAEEAPPIPSRSGRPARRQSSGDTAMSPPPRPPVPETPPRRMSVQVPSPETSPPQRKDSSHTPQYDYVMVDEIESRETLPTRRLSVPPLARPVPEVSNIAESQENISSQWELPSIPASTLDFGGGNDLSLSWSDAGESLSASQPTQSPSLRGQPRRQLTTGRSLSADDLMAMWGRVGVQVCEVATSLFDNSKKSLIGDGTYAGFIKAALADVPNAAQVSVDAGDYGYLVYSQNGSVVQKRASEIMPGDIIEVHDARFKGHKGLQAYQLTVGGSGELVVGIVAEFDIKKSKIKVFQANQHVGQQTVESVSYRLEDLKSGTIKIYRVLESV